ncbi:MAG: ribonuclease HIII, partial [Chlamydiae bacterium]|nr:ribonuclease HIII [Chlamydiota bacterium]
MSPACFVSTIDLSLKEKLEKDLIDQGFTLTPAPYAFFHAKKGALSCHLYHSGKITVQGKGKEDFISFYLEPEILKNLAFSHPETLHDGTSRIGLDEAGKGDFFGPLCVAGVYCSEGRIKELLQLGVRDSKQMSDMKVLSISQEVKKNFPHKTLCLFPETYNRLYAKFHNLNHMLAWAHSTLLEEMVKHTQCKEALLDQFAPPYLMESFLKKKNLEIHLVQKVRGEEDPVVAAASILARAAFLEGLKNLENRFQLNLPKGVSSLV